MFFPTSTYRIERGVMTDSYGDERESRAPIAEGVYGSVLSRQTTSYSADDDSVRRLSELIGRFPAGSNVKADDRIFDERSNSSFIVVDVVTDNTLLVTGDIVCSLTRNL